MRLAPGPAPRHLLIVLTDASPNDSRRIPPSEMCIRDRLQADRNRAYYAKNRELHRSVVLRLTEQIRNCILVPVS